MEQRFLLDQKIDDIIVKGYKETTEEDDKNWVYLSDVLRQYKQLQKTAQDSDYAKCFITLNYRCQTIVGV